MLSQLVACKPPPRILLQAAPALLIRVWLLCSGPVVAMVWEGKNVVATGRKIIGATNPLASEPGTIRGDFAIDVGRNIIHGSDSVESAKREIALWFKQEEIAEYTPTIKPWYVLASNQNGLPDGWRHSWRPHKGAVQGRMHGRRSACRHTTCNHDSKQLMICGRSAWQGFWTHAWLLQLAACGTHLLTLWRWS